MTTAPLLEARFQRFHDANPHVYERLRALAFDLLDRGVRRYGIAGLFEILRWEHAIETRGSPWVLNNSHRSMYSRLLLSREPRLANFFETRRQRAG